MASCRPASDPKTKTAGSVLPYRLGMPARNLPMPQDAATPHRILLDGHKDVSRFWKWVASFWLEA
jgi:hypothetical protein